MGLFYFLIKNLLTADPNDCIARITGTKILDREAFVQLIMQLKRLNRSDAENHVNVMEDMFLYAVENGLAINLDGFLRLDYSASGVFVNDEDVWDSNRHFVNANIVAGHKITAAANKNKPSKVAPKAVACLITSVYDNTDTPATNFKAATNFKLHGYGIKVQGTDPLCGLFMKGTAGNVIRLDAPIINTPTKVVGLIPAGTPPDTYEVYVVTQFNGSGAPGKDTHQSSSVTITVI